MAHGVNTAIKAMKPPRPHPMLDRAGREAQTDQLPMRNHAMLAAGQDSHPSITLVPFPFHSKGKWTSVMFSPP